MDKAAQIKLAVAKAIAADAVLATFIGHIIAALASMWLTARA